MIDLDDKALVDSHGQRLAFGAPVTALVWIGDTAWFACGDGRAHCVSSAGDRETFAVHKGAILCATAHPDGQSLLTGGDDGRLLRLSADGEVEELGAFGRHWVEHVVASPQSGLIVAAVGKEAVIWKPGQRDAAHRYGYGSTIGGLALDPKGKRLAASHYGGVTLTYASSADSGRVEMKWGGSHLACTMSPDGGYLVSAMQETGLHGWKLPQMADMAMSGYQGKTRSFSWSRRGKWLATSGDNAVIVWPFEGKTGPMGKRAVTLGGSDALVTRVAFYPLEDIIAAGYADGAVALLRVGDESFALVQAADGEAVSALAWSANAEMLAWGDEGGGGGLLAMNTLPR
jgi:WD40 repeat protein